jgi:hydrogenase expression/formation protein HypD
VKYIEEFQSKEAVLPVVEMIKNEVIPGKTYRLMEFCGGHTHVFFKTGLIDLLPPEVKLIHGPGCPVCVLPTHPIVNVIKLLSENKNIVLATYGDLLKVPTEDKDSLMKAKGRGLDIRSIYSPLEVLELAEKNPTKKIIFLAIGFETTIPPTVLLLKNAIKKNLHNLSIYCNHLNTAMALESILKNEQTKGLSLDGLIGPGHVALVTGAEFFRPFTEQYQKPIVISGFSAYDLAMSTLMLIRQVNESKYQLEVEYNRAFSQNTSQTTTELINEYLELRDEFPWRGLGAIEKSGFKLKDEYSAWDAEKIYNLEEVQTRDHPHCLCPQVLMGENNPLDCKLFSKACTPETPLGPCMVSSEGACSAYYLTSRTKENSKWKN